MMKDLSSDRYMELLVRVGSIINVDEIIEITDILFEGYDENQSRLLARYNAESIKKDNDDWLENTNLDTIVDSIIAKARLRELPKSDIDLLGVMQLNTDVNEIMDLSNNLELNIDREQAIEFAERNLKILLEAERNTIDEIRHNIEKEDLDIDSVLKLYDKLECYFARHNINWRHDPAAHVSEHEQEVALIRHLLFGCSEINEVLNISKQLNLPVDRYKAIKILKKDDADTAEIEKKELLTYKEALELDHLSDKDLLNKMLNNEIKIESDFYKKLIELMEADPEYRAYKTKKFENSRKMVEFYFPNDKVMHLDLVYGYDDAEFAFATMFLHGIIVEYDLNKALYWLKRAYHDNNQEAFGLIKQLMEDNNMTEDLKEFCVCCARQYEDREIKDYCAEHNIDYSSPSPKQQKLVEDYLSFYKRSPRDTTRRDRELIDLILTSKNENDTLKLIKELEPMADERLAKMFYSAKPYIDRYDYKDEVCDEPDHQKKQALMEKYEFSKRKQQAFWDCENALKLSEKEKMFVPRFIHDDSYLGNMERNSPNLSQYIRHKTYHDQSEIEKVCYRMLDDDHDLSFESAVTIVNLLVKQEEKDIELRKQKIEESNISPKDMVFYMGTYYKRWAVFHKYYTPEEPRTIEELMYDHMLNIIICETVVNALVPADIGAPMTWEALKERVNNRE